MPLPAGKNAASSTIARELLARFGVDGCWPRRAVVNRNTTVDEDLRGVALTDLARPRRKRAIAW